MVFQLNFEDKNRHLWKYLYTEVWLVSDIIHNHIYHCEICALKGSLLDINGVLASHMKCSEICGELDW